MLKGLVGILGTLIRVEPRVNNIAPALAKLLGDFGGRRPARLISVQPEIYLLESVKKGNKLEW